VAEGADRRLRELAEQLDCYGWAADLLDERWRLVWMSSDLCTIFGEPDPHAAGVGDHVLVRLARGLSRGVLTKESAERWLRTNGPYLLEMSTNDRQALSDILCSDWARILDACDPGPAPSHWMSAVDFSRAEFFGRLNYVGERITGEDGELLGYLFLYSLDVPAATAALLLRGERAIHQRMAALVRPTQRPAAVLFADLQASGTLSRQLPGPVYFRLIRDIRTALDAAVARCGGIIGKHAGDGVVGYFLTEQLGSDSRAARAALDAARRLPQLAQDAADELAAEDLPVDSKSCRLKVAVHWGPNLYVGQVASQGRLEITALGDEMNEAARIEQTAAGGQVLASKPLLERLEEHDAAALALDLQRVRYRALGQIKGASKKARRDAGSLAVTEIAL